jgi:hypothetical protein
MQTCGVLQSSKPLDRILTLLPLLYGSTVALVTWLVLLKAQLSACWSAWLVGVVTLAVGCTVGGAAALLLLPRVKQSLQQMESEGATQTDKAQATATQTLPAL